MLLSQEEVDMNITPFGRSDAKSQRQGATGRPREEPSSEPNQAVKMSRNREENGERPAGLTMGQLDGAMGQGEGEQVEHSSFLDRRCCSVTVLLQVLALPVSFAQMHISGDACDSAEDKLEHNRHSTSCANELKKLGAAWVMALV